MNSNYTLHLGDCLETLRGMEDDSVDSIVTDPPYLIGFMGKGWDHKDGVAGKPEVWRECLRVLKPGGHLLSFAGARTYHRITCAIEDAGFEIRDQIMYVFGSGFPKSHNGPWGGTALKPAHEPICVARKPLIGTVEANWSAYGTGALNIDGCRVVGQKRHPGNYHDQGQSGGDGRTMGKFTGSDRSEFDTSQGRWPANLIHDGSEEVLQSFPNAPGALAPVTGNEPSSSTSNAYGKYKRAASDRTGEASADSDNVGAVGFKMKPGARRAPEGSAARFFYCAKASKADRSSGMGFEYTLNNDVSVEVIEKIQERLSQMV